MTSRRCDILSSSLFVLIVFFTFTTESCAELGQLKASGNWFDLNQVKVEFFESNFGDGDQKLSRECKTELEAIQNGLEKHEPWAIKLVDAWGKFPSGVLNGNFYDFEGFSECFHIERNNSHYESKYCMGQLEFDLKGILAPKSNLHNINNMIFGQDIRQTGGELQITPRMVIPPPTQGSAIVFGLCIPKTCSLDALQQFFKFNQTSNNKKSIKLLESTCQLEENASELRVIDWATIGLLLAVSVLIVASTIYDIVCTINGYQKCEAFLAFSFYTNGMKLLSHKRAKSSDTMHCLHGIRALSTQWVVLGHSFAIYSMTPVKNIAEFPRFLSHYQNMLIASAPIAVDSFFVLSGLLVSYNMLKHLEKTNGRINVPLLYFHRYLRLTPLLAVSFLFSMTLLRFLGNGPIWPSLINFLSQQCERNWWSTLLYVQNYVNPSDICFGHSWYLSVDMQLFLLAPFIIYVIYRSRFIAQICMIIMIGGCVGCTLALHAKYGLKGVFQPVKLLKAYYQTHIRFSPWLIGVILGDILFNKRNKPIHIPRMLNLVGWTLSFLFMATVIFSNYPLIQVDSKALPIEFGLYDGLSRVFWAIALSYVIFACVHGYGGPINQFLSHPLWQPISRLCYSVYLLHFPTILLMNATMKTTPYFTELSAFHSFFGNYALTVAVSVVATLAFESPILIIEKIIFGAKKKAEATP